MAPRSRWRSIPSAYTATRRVRRGSQPACGRRCRRQGSPSDRWGRSLANAAGDDLRRGLLPLPERGEPEPAPHYRHVGEGGLLVEFANEISPAVNRQVRTLLAALDAAPPPGLIDLIPAYRTLLILF